MSAQSCIWTGEGGARGHVEVFTVCLWGFGIGRGVLDTVFEGGRWGMEK